MKIPDGQAHEESQVSGTSEVLVEAAVERPGTPDPSLTSSTPGVDGKPAADSSSNPLSMPEGTLAEMKAKNQALVSELASRSGPILKQRFESGLSELVSKEQKYTGMPDDEVTIAGVWMVSGQGTYRVPLPRSEYPDLYELKDATNRLKTLIAERELQDPPPPTSTGSRPASSTK